MQDVEERRVARADQAVREHVRVRRAALTGDRVHALDVLRAEVVEGLRHEAHGLVLADAGAEEAVEVLVGRVDHRGGLGEQADLVRRLHAAGLHEDLLAVDDLDALLLQGEEDGQLDHVDTERLVREPELLELALDLLGHLLRDLRFGRERLSIAQVPMWVALM